MEDKTKNITIKNEKTPKKRKIVKIIIWSLTIFIALLFLTASIIAYVFEDKIADIVLKELYKSMKTEIKHKNVSFSLIRKFPMASLKIDDLQVQGLNEKRDVLIASYVYLQFNFLDLLTTNYKLKRIEIKNANLRLKVFKDGRANWDFFSIKDSSNKDFVVNLNLISLKNVHVIYESLENDIELGLNVYTLTTKGDFIKQTFDMQITTDLTLDSLKVDTSFVLYDKDLIINTKMLIDNENDHYQFNSLKVQLDRLKFNADLDLQKKEKNWNYSIALNAKELIIKDVLNHMPDYVNEIVKGYELGGLLHINLMIKGKTGKQKKIDIQSKYAIKKGMVYNIANNIGLINLRLAGSFRTTGFQLLQSTTLQISDLKAILNKKNISANLYIKNLQTPFVRFHLESNVNLEDWQRFMPKNYIYDSKGKAELNIDFESQLKGFTNITIADLEKATINGMITLSDVYLQLTQGETAIKEINGKVALNNQVLYLDDLNGKINDNNFIIDGKIDNFYDYIFNKQVPMNIVANVSSPYLNMNTFLSQKKNITTTQKSEETFSLAFPDNINFNLKLSINKFVFDKLEAIAVNGDVMLKDNVFTVNKLNLKTFAGNIMASGYAQKQANKTFLLYCSAKLNDIDVQQMFYSFNNFGQSANGLTDKNIRGMASANILFKTIMKDNGELLTESVDVLSNITINNGQLINFKPLESLSKFVDLEDLYNIRFATLHNHIQIKNQAITISEMDIKNNALNLTLSGCQWFNGDLDYYIKIKMSEILSKKFQLKRKNKEEDFGEIINDNTDNNYIHITATGNLDNPKFKWSRKDTKKETKEQIKTQKEDFKTIFKSETEKIGDTKQKEKELNDPTKKNLDIEIDENW